MTELLLVWKVFLYFGDEEKTFGFAVKLWRKVCRNGGSFSSLHACRLRRHLIKVGNYFVQQSSSPISLVSDLKVALKLHSFFAPRQRVSCNSFPPICQIHFFSSSHFLIYFFSHSASLAFESHNLFHKRHIRQICAFVD